MERQRFPFYERLDQLAAEHGPDACWPWPDRLQPDGYGRVHAGGTTRIVHRAAYEWCVGPIPDGMELDHLCRVKHCINPRHLEPVTRDENMARRKVHKTHCKRGHAFTSENTYNYEWTRKDGSTHRVRICAACQSERGRKSRVRVGRQAPDARRNSRHAPLPPTCGHPRTPENTYTRPDGRGTECRTCRSAKFRAWRERHKSV